MLTIKTYYNKNMFILDADGHCGYNAHGKDIICSAVSTLLYTFVISVQRICDYNGDLNDSEDIFHYEVNLDKVNSDVFFIILKVLLCGLKIIEDDYSKYIKVIME